MVTSRLTTIPAKKTAVRVIDTSKGGIVIKGEGAWTGQGEVEISRSKGSGLSQAEAEAIYQQRLEAQRQVEVEAQAKREAERLQILQTQKIQQQIQQRQIIESAAARRGTMQQYTTKQKIFNAVKEFAAGETGKRFIGFGQQTIGFSGYRKIPLGITSSIPLITAEKTKEVLREKGKLPGKVVAEFIPETPLEVGIIGGTVAIFPYVPVIARIPIGTGISIMEIKQAFNPQLPTEQRIASGIIGGLVGTGTFFESLPFIKGGIARLSPKYKPTKVQPEGFKAVVEVKGAERIGLIPKGAPLKTGETKDISLPIISPLRRGGFGITPSQKPLYFGEQIVATSQRGFFKEGTTMTLEREFFVTPAEPFINIPETRISRLGLADLTKIPKEVEIGFGFPLMPQIGITKTSVGLTETSSQFAIGKGTELEAIKTFGSITDINKLGVTTIKGQAVDVYGFKIGGKGTGTIQEFPMTTQGKTRTSGEILTGITGKIKSFFPSKTTGSTSVSAMTTSTSFIDYYPTIPSSPTKPISPTFSSSSSGGSPPFIPPSTPNTPPPTFKSPTSRPPTFKSPTIKTPATANFVLPKLSSSKIPLKDFKPSKQFFGKFSVFGRRFGKFKLVGISGTEKGAFSLGKKFAGETLGATFKIPGVSGRKLPGYKTKFTKEGALYIEPRGRRLKRGTQEIPEIQFFKRLKGGRKR